MLEQILCEIQSGTGEPFRVLNSITSLQDFVSNMIEAEIAEFRYFLPEILQIIYGPGMNAGVVQGV